MTVSLFWDLIYKGDGYSAHCYRMIFSSTLASFVMWDIVKIKGVPPLVTIQMSASVREKNFQLTLSSLV